MRQVPLSALTQIGDVVLVHDESAVMDDNLRSRGLVRLVGHAVQSYDGTPLGKVGSSPRTESLSAGGLCRRVLQPQSKPSCKSCRRTTTVLSKRMYVLLKLCWSAVITLLGPLPQHPGAARRCGTLHSAQTRGK